MLINMHPADISYILKRPCLIKAKKSGPKECRKERKAYFHQWFLSSKGVQQILGLVEFEDGHMEQLQPTNIIFVDGGDFEEWEDRRNEKSKEE